MIDKVQSIQFIAQMQTYNRPVEAICKTDIGLDVYYIKYARSGFESHGLIAEIVCHFLAKKLNLENPDIAYVVIGNHPIPDQFQFANNMNEGKITFGSKLVKNTEDELTKLEFDYSKHEFNRLEIPEHLLRIGLFDLWIGNNDRTDHNYNLFLTRGKTQKLVVFDHFEAFNKIAEHTFEYINTEIDVYSNGFLSTNFAYKMLEWVPKGVLKTELSNFFTTINDLELDNLLQAISDTYPPGWDDDLSTVDYIKRFLSSKERLDSIRSQVTDYINYLPEKS